ncbi:uncharacterized protein BKA55DRAFT_576467 [Fusarium redolens]|uniref:Uncharacterized protein n=1 Tax=Fusarium redolens TaxID=48865 RepID=A0A9P9GKZ8_FUSRE|nr:uncharacterized protein BKA55DRAFT_576467 [Fusarium redolens]KAH7241081.1 hypothetical protein BKA55DRAFT_576467 [Fusarium redolens]
MNCRMSIVPSPALSGHFYQHTIKLSAPSQAIPTPRGRKTHYCRTSRTGRPSPINPQLLHLDIPPFKGSRVNVFNPSSILADGASADEWR